MNGMSWVVVIGITGGICSGKSSVTEILRESGAIVLDADKFGHKAYEVGTAAYDSLVTHFGHDIVGEGGEINRRRLGEIVFSDASQMQELQKIVWPEIRRLLSEELERIRSSAKAEEGNKVTLVALEAAVMIEAGWQDLASELWVVYVDREIAQQRLMERNNLSAEDAEKRIASQITNEERIHESSMLKLSSIITI